MKKLLLATVMLVTMFAASAQKQTSKKPNIILIMVDVVDYDKIKPQNEMAIPGAEKSKQLSAN